MALRSLHQLVLAVGISMLALLTAGCASTPPEVVYYNMADPEKLPKEGVTDVFALDQATVTATLPTGATTGSKPLAGAIGGLFPNMGDAPNIGRLPSKPASEQPSPKSADAGEAAKADKPSAQPAKTSVNVALSEAADYRIGFVEVNDLRKTTRLSLTKRDNTEMVASIGTETTDNLNTSIAKIGGLITKLVTWVYASGSMACPSHEFAVESDSVGVVRKTAAPCISYTLGPVPKEAIRFSDIPWGRPVSVFYYAACRNLKVTVETISTKQVFEFKVPDPQYVQSVRLPAKGTIKKHSTCGVSTVTESQASPTSSVEALTELLTQVNNIREAAKNDGK